MTKAQNNDKKSDENPPKSAIFHPLAFIKVLKPHFRPSFWALISGAPAFQCKCGPEMRA